MDVRSRQFLSLLLAALGLVSCNEPEGPATWDNPLDPDGVNYVLPTVKAMPDTSFRDSMHVAVRADGASANGKVEMFLWTMGKLHDSTAEPVWHPKSGLGEGIHTIVVRLRDANGLKSPADSVHVTVFDPPPSLTKVHDTLVLIGRLLSVRLAATDSLGSVKRYLFDTTGHGWDSSTLAPTLKFSSTGEATKKVKWAARDDLGKLGIDSFTVTFSLDRPQLTALADTVLSATRILSLPLKARDLDPSGSVEKFLWSDSGSLWTDSSDSPSLTVSDTSGGVVPVRWVARNSLGNYSKPDTFQATFVHPVSNLTIKVDSNLSAWTGTSGTLLFKWSGAIGAPLGETIAWTLSFGPTGKLVPVYSGKATSFSQTGVVSGASKSYRLVGKSRVGDSTILTGTVFPTYLDTVENPKFSLVSGRYPKAQMVFLTCATPGATIFYTTDGSTPTTSSTIFVDSIPVMETENLQAIAAKIGYANSPVVSANYTLTGGTFTDSRDQQTYNWVMIGSQVWMAQNLNYADGGVCYNNDPANCKTYGRLYTWKVAMNGAEPSSSSPSAVQGICPSDWHIPSNDEWTTLQNVVDLTHSVDGTRLKSTTGWLAGGDGTDVYGFAALPAGYLDDLNAFKNVGDDAKYWSTTLEYTFSSYPDSRGLASRNSNMAPENPSWNYGLSLRCVRN